MIILCPICNNELEVNDDIVDGQHIKCPYCDGKFSYAEKHGVSEGQEYSYAPAQRSVTRIPLSSAQRPIVRLYNEKKRAASQEVKARMSLGMFLLKSFYVSLLALKTSTKFRCGRIEYGMILFEAAFWSICGEIVRRGLKKYFSMTGDLEYTGLDSKGLIVFVGIIASVLFLLLVIAIIRRFHDSNRSGWWTLALFVPSLFTSWLGYHGLESVLLVLTAVMPLFLPVVEMNNRFNPAPLKLTGKRREWVVGLVCWPIKLAILIGTLSFTYNPTFMYNPTSGNAPVHEKPEIKRIDCSKMSNAEFRAIMLKTKNSTMVYLKGQQAKQIAFRDRIRDSGYGLALERYDEDDKLISLWVCSGYSKGELKRGLEEDTLVYPRWLPFSEAKAIWNALQINWDNKIQKAEIEFDERMMVLRDKDGRLIDRTALRAKIEKERGGTGSDGYITIVPESVEEKTKNVEKDEPGPTFRKGRRRVKQ